MLRSDDMEQALFSKHFINMTKPQLYDIKQEGTQHT